MKLLEKWCIEESHIAGIKAGKADIQKVLNAIQSIQTPAIRKVLSKPCDIKSSDQRMAAAMIQPNMQFVERRASRRRLQD